MYYFSISSSSDDIPRAKALRAKTLKGAIEAAEKASGSMRSYLYIGDSVNDDGYIDHLIASRKPDDVWQEPEVPKKRRGRPISLGMESAKRYSLYLDEDTFLNATSVGNGSASRGIREAISFYMEHHPKLSDKIK